MSLTRRKFIRNISGAAGALALTPLACGLSNGNEKIFKEYGIQLYTLRDILPGKAKEIIAQLSEFGFTQIESYSGPDGMFWGMTPKEFRNYLSDHGMKAVASHADYTKDLERTAADAAEAGMKYLVCPWLGPQENIEAYQRRAEEFNTAGKICRKEGLRFAYHNHDYSFQAINDIFPQDILMKETDPELVDFEMDIYWVVTAGQDPVSWLQKYPNRFTLSHVKDRKKSVPATEKYATCTLGEGSINFASILEEAKKQGMKLYLLEQEHYENCDPLTCSKKGAAFLNKFKS